MTDAELLAIIAQAEREGWTELDLSENDLEGLPIKIGRLQSLERLILGKWDDKENKRKGNRSTAIPQEIFQLTNLKELHISYNQITAIPDAIANLVNLTTLSLDSNKITFIPDAIGNLVNLTTLSLDSNKITFIPDAIGNLVNLMELRLHGNKITFIPDAIASLTNLTALTLSCNQITRIPDAITCLSNLENLSLWDNQISEIPKEINKLQKLQGFFIRKNQIRCIPYEVSELKNLKRLWLDNNQIAQIPSNIGKLINLKELWIDNNLIQELPEEIAELKNLEELDLLGNSLVIPYEILADTKNPKAIISYWQKLKQGERKPLNEAKVILIGHGAVGKTSLVRQLIDRNFKPDETKTEGIDIRHWKITAREETVKLRVWDFGGQEIMHATHQFFLTERSLYLLVLNARKDEGNNDVEYWLKIVESFGKDSPVLIIANKSDEHPLKLNRRHLQEKYPNIQGFFETSCKTGLGIDDLRKEIAQQIAAMDHVFNELPQQWFRLKEQIEQDNRDHISYTEYECICNDPKISDRQERRDLIRLLHLLGIVLNFAEDTRLQDTSVLNPEWVTGGVYRILNDNLLSTKHKGMLNWQDLTRILTPKNKGDRDCYQETRDRQFILDMMQKFELCFPIDGNSQKPIYLIPELLDEEEPDTGIWENTLNLEYHYKILFSSVISRFIVKMHHCISKRTYWRTGVILAFPEGNRAYIKADLADAKIFIRIDGNPNTRRSSLAAIRNNFESIHQSISALEVDERVPLPDNPKVSISYKHLLKLETKGETNYFPEGSDHDYNIRELLDGISNIEDRRSRNEKTESRGDIIYNFYEPTGQVITGNVNPAGNNIGTQNNNLSQNPALEVSQPNKTSSATKPMKTILLLAANPKNTNPLRLQEEERDIKERLRLAGYGTEPIKSAVAVRPRDIQQSILDFDPQIIHFSGHGGDEAGLVFEDIDGNPKLISGEALADLFALFSDRLECVVLNACYSETQAHAMSQHINYVIGMDRKIGDRAAIEFAVGFYTALGANKPYDFAFKLGCNAIRLAGIDEVHTPKLLKK